MIDAPPSCRLCLITPASIDPAMFPAALVAALDGGDVASLIVAGTGGSPAAEQRIAEILVPIAQERGIAALVHNDTRLMGRSGADGVHIDAGTADLDAALASFRGKRIVGAAGALARHEAMGLGEREPDYLFFGRLDGDREDGIFRKARELAEWWSGLFEIPALLMGGRRVDSVAEARAAGVEFVALRDAVWYHPDGPGAAVADANRLLAAEVPA